MPRGIVRYIDPLGRITLPKEMRKSLSLKEGDKVDIYFHDEVICIRPVAETGRPKLADFTEEELMAELFRRQGN